MMNVLILISFYFLNPSAPFLKDKENFIISKTALTFDYLNCNQVVFNGTRAQAQIFFGCNNENSELCATAYVTGFSGNPDYRVPQADILHVENYLVSDSCR